MAHDHHDHHHQTITSVNKAFIIGIVLNIAFVALEFAGGYYYHSLALISDAGHNLTDVSSLLISLFAFKMMKAKATQRFTYGYKKASILASLLNAVLLLITIAFIIYEGIRRAENPQPLQGNIISYIAVAGIFVNGISALLFFKNKEKDINVKGAYLHLMADAVVSLGVVVAGVVISYTQWYWIDTVVSFIIAIVILVATWKLFTASVRLAMDGLPDNVDTVKVKETILKFDDVQDVHHIHIWALSSNENALTAHLVTKNISIADFEKTKHAIKHELEHLNISHATLEVETGGCGEESCEV